MKRPLRFSGWAFFLFLLFCFLPIYGESTQKIRESAKESVAKLDLDVKLTSEQRAKLEAASELFFERLDELNKIEDMELRFQSQSFVYGSYEASIDSVLRVDQKELRTKKVKERNEKDEKKIKNAK